MAVCYSALAAVSREYTGIFLHCVRTWTYRLAHEKFQFSFYVWHSCSSTIFFSLLIRMSRACIWVWTGLKTISECSRKLCACASTSFSIIVIVMICISAVKRRGTACKWMNGCGECTTTSDYVVCMEVAAAAELKVGFSSVQWFVDCFIHSRARHAPRRFIRRVCMCVVWRSHRAKNHLFIILWVMTCNVPFSGSSSRGSPRRNDDDVNFVLPSIELEKFKQ